MIFKIFNSSALKKFRELKARFENEGADGGNHNNIFYNFHGMHITIIGLLIEYTIFSLDH